MSGDCLGMAQLADNRQGTVLIAAQQVSRPADVAPGTPQWQRWAVDAMREAIRGSKFSGKDVVAALPPGEIFVDHLKYPKKLKGSLEDAVLSKIKSKLPFQSNPKNTMVKCVAMEQDNLMVLAAERATIERNLAIYEHAGLKIKSIGVWPMAMANCYGRFFGQRKVDLDAVVMLLDIQSDRSNLVISRNRDPLFAMSIPIGAVQLQDEKGVGRLILELTAARRQFLSIYQNMELERLIFLSGSAVDSGVYRTIGQQLEMRAQLGDCLAAVEIKDGIRCGVDRRGSQGSWALAFGLGLC